MNIAVYDEGCYKIFEGLSAEFLSDNDADKEVADALTICREKGIVYFGGGAAPEFMIVRVAKG